MNRRSVDCFDEGRIQVRAKWVTFDCYGTLIDWERGIRAFFESLIGVQGGRLDVLVADWEETQFALITGPYRPYREVLGLSLREVLHQYGHRSGPNVEAEFAHSLTTWQPFADSNQALEQLRRRGFRLGIISNIDNDLIASTLQHFTVPFDLVMTAEQSRAYKPSVQPFQTALDQMACPSPEVVHAAFGDRYDLAPARRCGIQTVFVNRRGKRIAFQADAEITQLTDLPDLIEHE